MRLNLITRLFCKFVLLSILIVAHAKAEPEEKYGHLKRNLEPSTDKPNVKRQKIADGFERLSLEILLKIDQYVTRSDLQNFVLATSSKFIDLDSSVHKKRFENAKTLTYLGTKAKNIKYVIDHNILSNVTGFLNPNITKFLEQDKIIKLLDDESTQKLVIKQWYEAALKIGHTKHPPYYLTNISDLINTKLKKILQQFPSDQWRKQEWSKMATALLFTMLFYNNLADVIIYYSLDMRQHMYWCNRSKSLKIVEAIYSQLNDEHKSLLNRQGTEMGLTELHNDISEETGRKLRQIWHRTLINNKLISRDLVGRAVKIVSYAYMLKYFSYYMMNTPGGAFDGGLSFLLLDSVASVSLCLEIYVFQTSRQHRIIMINNVANQMVKTQLLLKFEELAGRFLNAIFDSLDEGMASDVFDCKNSWLEFKNLYFKSLDEKSLEMFTPWINILEDISEKIESASI